MSNFCLIRDVGIFPTALMGPILPQFSERVSFNVLPPPTSKDEFKFVLIHETDISVGFTLQSNAVLKKGEEPEIYEDSEHFMTEISEKVFSEEEFLRATSVESDDEDDDEDEGGKDSDDDDNTNIIGMDEDQLSSLRGLCKNYRKHLARIEEFNAAMAGISSSTEGQSEVQSRVVDAVKEIEPSESDKKKQAKRLPKLENKIAEALNEVLGGDDVEADDLIENTEKVLKKIFTEDDHEIHMQKVMNASNSLLASFFDKNFRDAEDAVSRVKNASSGVLRNDQSPAPAASTGAPKAPTPLRSIPT